MKPTVIGRLGPARNLRPAGAHRQKARNGSRKAIRVALRQGREV